MAKKFLIEKILILFSSGFRRRAKR